jgi:predicted AlkP superfamily pyrophosphatase or phosphodiesterase
MYSLDSVTPTICELMNVRPPKGSTTNIISEVTSEAMNNTIKKALLYAPDAIGEWLFQAHRYEFKDVIKEAPIQVKIQSMNPSSTPVCYSSMFTGLKPEEHGITKYMKPVLKVETLFDTLAEAGKKVSLVAVKDCSIDLVFRGRDIDYYTEEYDPQVNERVLQLLEETDYDLIVAYNQEYDDVMHKSTPTSPEALKAFRRHLETFKMLADAFNKRYRSDNRVIAFLPDHGTHVDPETGKGTHHTDSPEDMKVRHFWGIYLTAREN